MLQVEAVDVVPPRDGQIRRLGPCHHSHNGWGGCGGRGRRLTSTRISVPRTSGRGFRVPRVACSWGLGCRLVQARTRTLPYCASVTVYSSEGGSQVAWMVGSAQANVWPWRGGRPVVDCSLGVVSA